MKKILENITVALVLLLAMAAGGCTTDPKFSGAIQLVPNSEIVVVRATAHRKPDGILVGGDVRRTNGYAGAVPGHLEVVGRDRSGNIVATSSTPWGQFISRRFRLAYFKVLLLTPDPSTIATIRIEPVTP